MKIKTNENVTTSAACNITKIYKFNFNNRKMLPIRIAI